MMRPRALAIGQRTKALIPVTHSTTTPYGWSCLRISPCGQYVSIQSHMNWRSPWLACGLFYYLIVTFSPFAIFPPKQNHLTLMSLAHESFIFSGLHGDSALKMSAKRYTYALSDRNTHGLTLIFAHGIGSRRFQLNLLQLRALIVYYPVIDKEHWEPVLQHIFQLQNSKGESYRIREAWSFDWQNHGDSAVLNYAALKAQKPGVCKFFKSYHFTVHWLSSAIYEWTPAITAFIRSPRMKDHRIVPLGHSAGASAMYWNSILAK